MKKKVDGLWYKDSIEASPGTVYEYDGLNRAVRVTDALGGINSSEYDILGNVIKQTDALQNATNFVYNPDGTLAKATYPDQGSIRFIYVD